jgi:two-component system, NarL family, sensor kinase
MAPDSWSWERRRRLAVGIHVTVACAALVTALVTAGQPRFEPVSLVVVLGGFAIACELLSVKVTHSLSTPENPWWFATSAPYVLAVVFLGPVPALAMAALSLLIAAARDHTDPPHVVANLANYGMHIATQGVLVAIVVDELHVAPDDLVFALLLAVIYQCGATASLLYNAAYDALAYGDDVRTTLRSGWRLQMVADPPLAIATGLTAFVYASSGEDALIVLVALQLVFIFMAREVVRSQERALALERRSDELLALTESRGRLVGEVLVAEESERRRLAEALHDEAMQNLLTARQDLHSADAADIGRARRGIDATVEQLREAIFELHPAVLDHAGPVAAIEAIAERHSRHSGVTVSIEADTFERTEHDRLVFTICRELLANVGSHAAASHVDLALRTQADVIELEVRDDGCGFDPSEVGSALEHGHIGLASTMERIEAVDGSFRIDSRPGAGTIVRVTLPIHHQDDARSRARPAVPAGRLVPDAAT